MLDHEVHWLLAEHEILHEFHLSGIPLLTAVANDQAEAKIKQYQQLNYHHKNHYSLIFTTINH